RKGDRKHDEHDEHPDPRQRRRAEDPPALAPPRRALAGRQQPRRRGRTFGLEPGYARRGGWNLHGFVLKRAPAACPPGAGDEIVSVPFHEWTSGLGNPD